ncbi:UDP-N-acetylmuramoyl-tripeptide--D-alanyl-D-alanine ligase [Aestuariirhabdus sp. Z084]|uniref:UDP-N-acetylmuramoyl-tripeptide--D-alanyl-D- alanine ligase n=1 Tax=Aestuariirhabdus haliotis TaxID=2918751 RepID=UPI00201B448B|nr:UDP-N-acetylmuramoyl-tripeptide--D-alanyl-D-alanine ligase [Aestuariirhabdus haliotis]MCL6415915.1 UDP-N-acetylmuramoyl-tripeptide--D-alanyl-D-alanine ligase [Aestuariirhabdus haliotis]MCL6419913.1 UDP-N-acetylmuramoyl-tripeptide--D-alanyl-D-alanine ligase [Aestuariirhabdus haliotis]
MIGQPKLSQLVAPLKGKMPGGDCSFSSVSIDTRTLQPGALFVAIEGPSFDGHEFLAEARKAGAVAAIVSRAVDTELPQLQVEDTRIALGLIGQWVRQQFEGAVIAITGSSGKTSVKELSAAILAQQGKVHATRGNLNNDFGAPLTLCQLECAHHNAVIELGASAIGEISYTVGLVKPDVALINNASAAHIEGFGSLRGIAQAKGEILSGLSAEGVAVLNLDDPFFGYWQGVAANRRLVSFSLHRLEADVHAADVEVGSDSSRFTLCYREQKLPVNLQLPGEHNIANAIAAAACCIALGVSLPQVVAGLESAQPVSGRGVVVSGVNDCKVIDDSYNANPASFKAAVDLLSKHSGNKVLVMGDMAELGSEAIEAHRHLGEYARQRGIDALYTVGPLSAEAAMAFGADAFSTLNKQELVDNLIKAASKNTVFLIKGSRSARMEEVVAAMSEKDLGGAR